MGELILTKHYLKSKSQWSKTLMIYLNVEARSPTTFLFQPRGHSAPEVAHYLLTKQKDLLTKLEAKKLVRIQNS